MADLDFILLDSGSTFRKQLGIERTFQVSTSADIDTAFQKCSKRSLWILNSNGRTNTLLKSLVQFGLHQQRMPALGKLLFTTPPRASLVPPFLTYFQAVAGEVESFRILPLDQLTFVLTSEDRQDLFIGGSVDQDSETITLIRGNMSGLVVPFSLFESSDADRPDFHRLALDDFGYAIRLGDYESSAHAILFEIDREYRRRFNQQRIQSEKGFGASLRRLRNLRRIPRTAIEGVSAKTIARLERGQTKPQILTLNRIAKALGVMPNEIETY